MSETHDPQQTYILGLEAACDRFEAHNAQLREQLREARAHGLAVSNVLQKEIDGLRMQRDEARAEIERLRSLERGRRILERATQDALDPSSTSADVETRETRPAGSEGAKRGDSDLWVGDVG